MTHRQDRGASPTQSVIVGRAEGIRGSGRRGRPQVERWTGRDYSIDSTPDHASLAVATTEHTLLLDRCLTSTHPRATERLTLVMASPIT